MLANQKWRRQASKWVITILSAHILARNTLAGHGEQILNRHDYKEDVCWWSKWIGKLVNSWKINYKTRRGYNQFEAAIEVQGVISGQSVSLLSVPAACFLQLGRHKRRRSLCNCTRITQVHWWKEDKLLLLLLSSLMLFSNSLFHFS